MYNKESKGIGRMKYEIGTKKPDNLKEYWPGQYDFFSHFEYISGIPHALFLITTRKENGFPNACFHSWSGFSGDSGGFFAVMPGLMQHTHTFRNIVRDKEFCINFLSPGFYEACQKTIHGNSYDVDELAAAGFNPEPAQTVHAPRIKEAFLTYECRLDSVTDLSGKGISAMIVGRVLHAAIDENHRDIEAVCGDNGFMFYIHAPKDLRTGEGEKGAIAQLRVVKDE